MSRNSDGSSVDPEDVHATIRDDKESVSFSRTRPNSDHSSCSLSAMSDLENDAVPWTPVTSFPPASDPQPSSGAAPGTPGGDYFPSLRDEGAQVPGAGCVLPHGASIQQPVNHLSTSGAGDNQGGDQAVPDETYPFQRDLSKDSLSSSHSEPIQEPYDAVIICHPDDREQVQEIKAKLNKLILFDNMPARVAIEEDEATLGKGEISYFEHWLDKAEIMFLFASREFCLDLQCTFKVDVALVESFFVEFGKKEFVIPIFIDPKYRVKYLSPSMRAIKGIDFINSKWDGRIEKKFEHNLNSARKKRKQRELEDGMVSLNVGD